MTIYREILRFAVFAAMSATLLSCSFFKEREIKAEATKAIRAKVRQTLEVELQATLGDKNVRGKDFVDFVQNHTEVNVESMQEISPTQYHLETSIRSPSPEVRKVIFEILSKLDAKKANSFNFADAMDLIHQQRPEMTIETEQKSGFDLHEAHGNWVL
jgi:hypothetical protein